MKSAECFSSYKDLGLVGEVFSPEILSRFPRGTMAVGHVRYGTTGSTNRNNCQPIEVNHQKGKMALAHNGNLSNAMYQLDGAYSLVLMSSQKLICARDPYGFRPLCCGKMPDGTWVVASESCGLTAIGAFFVRDIESGEILAREHPADADVVVGVPDSGLDAALGFAAESGIPYGIGFIKNKYIGRTFISPGQSTRLDQVRIKLSAVEESVRGKRVVLIDDSIVRGTTSGRIAKLLREAADTAAPVLTDSILQKSRKIQGKTGLRGNFQRGRDKADMVTEFDKKIILEDGQEYYGYGFGDPGERICEIVFNTSMVGYQEILSDPSYTDQAVVMTYPLIGNYGMTDEDYEAAEPSMGALIVREYNDRPSNFRSTATLSQVMEKYHIPGVYGVDTRKLNRSIREFGSRRALITDASTSLLQGLKMLEGYRMRTDQVSRVSCRETYVVHGDTERYHVAAIDCGMKQGIVRNLNRRGCRVTVVPWNTPAEELERLRPDGIFISNGPGDPENVPETIETVKRLLGRYPIFGICLGHQIISLAYGAKTYKLKFGHRGGNHPVRNLSTGKIEITSQNHSYAVDRESLAGTGLIPTHLNLLDGTVEGVKCGRDRVFSVQYHPESSPGPRDSAYLFDRFLEMMEEGRHA